MTQNKASKISKKSNRTNQESPIDMLASMWARTLRQFVEHQDWDHNVVVWQHFRQSAQLPAATKALLVRMLKKQERLMDVLHDRYSYAHYDYVTTAAIPYELLTCHALLSWASGAMAVAALNCSLQKCDEFYAWAMKPGAVRTSRAAATRGIHRQFFAVARRVADLIPKSAAAA